MIDLYNREITYLRISITEECNMRCVYCLGEEACMKNRKNAAMTPEEILRIAEACVSLGIEKIRVTGGEPLIRRDVVSICNSLGQIEGVKELTMTTNGLLLQEYALPLKEAGVSRVNISLDTMDENKFKMITGSEQLDRIRCGIECAKKAGLLPIKINVVLLSGINENEIEKFVRWTQSDQIEVRFIELMPVGTARQYERFSFLNGNVVFEKVPELIPIAANGVANLYKLPDGKGKVGIIRPVSRHFCPSCNRIRLTSDGKIKPCLHSAEEIDVRHLTGEQLKEAIRGGILHKPMEHGGLQKGEGSCAKRNMNQIGG